MFCKFCGKEIETDIKFCPHCGKNIEGSHNNGFAIVSLVLGILSSIFYGLAIFQVLAVIFGIVALVKIKRKKASGKVMAIIGLILGIVYILQFGLKIFQNTEYYDKLYQQAFMESEAEVSENSNDKEKFNLLGEWYYKFSYGECVSICTYTIQNYTYVYSVVDYDGDGNIISWFTRSGRVEQKDNNTAILYEENFTNVYNATAPGIGKVYPGPQEIIYKDGALHSGALVFMPSE